MPKNRINNKIIICLLSLAGIWSGLYYHMTSERNMVIADAEVSSANLTLAFEEHVKKTVQNIDGLLLQLRSEYQRNPDGFGNRIRFIAEHKSVAELLVQVSVIDKQGIMAFSSKGLTAVPVDLSDREHFRIHLTGQNDQLFISKPVLGRVSKIWSIQFTRKIVDNSGSFAGVLVLSIDPDYFSNFYKGIDIGSEGVISLVGMDGIIRARASKIQTGTDPKGLVVPKDRPFLDLSKPAVGVYKAASVVDRVVRISTYRRLQEYPLVVVVMQTEEDILSASNARRVQVISVGLLVSAIVLLLGWIFWRNDRRRRSLIEELDKSEQRMRMIFNNAPLGIMHFDANGIIVDVNDKFAGIMGGARENIIGFNMLEKLRDQAMLTAVKDALSGSMGHYEGDYVSITAGKTTPMRAIYQRITTEEGNFLGAVGIFEDITERKQIEATLRRLANEQSIILENAGVGITFVQNRQFKWINTSLCQMFSYSLEEFTDASTRIIYPSQEDFEQTGQEAYSVLATGRTYSKELLLRRCDGSQFHALYNGRAINPADPLAGSIWIISDETERYDLQTKLVDARDTAESANRAKSAFLANMSHEIRTPMNGVMGMTQLLELTDLTPEQKEYVAALRTSSNNLLSLINDILDLSKIEAGKLTVELSEFSLNQCIKDVALMQKSVAFEKQLVLDVDVDRNIPHVLLGDQLRIKQILLNLLGNALKFTSQGKISVSAQLLEQSENSALVQIKVSDSGIGISSEVLDKIFQPFVQEDCSTTRKFGGTGLGLTITLRLVELMGGSISVESTPSSGSCFTVILPFSVISNVAIAVEIHTTAQFDGDGTALRILLAEDNPTNIIFGTSILKKMGHEVTVAENGRECLTALENGKFDLVLMDIQMPVMNGKEALGEIRREENEAIRHLPVIAVTAYSMRGDRERFLEEGFDGYISKPMMAAVLKEEIKRVLAT